MDDIRNFIPTESPPLLQGLLSFAQKVDVWVDCRRFRLSNTRIFLPPRSKSPAGFPVHSDDPIPIELDGESESAPSLNSSLVLSILYKTPAEGSTAPLAGGCSNSLQGSSSKLVRAAATQIVQEVQQANSVVLSGLQQANASDRAGIFVRSCRDCGCCSLNHSDVDRCGQMWTMMEPHVGVLTARLLALVA